MKKTIQKGKVCVINKLVKKLRETKKKLETQPKTLQLSTKTARLTEQISYLRQTPNVELGTLCLVSQANPNRILTNALSSANEISLAHLCLQKLVATKIEQIKDKYNLNDTTVEWRSLIREIGKKKQKKVAMETNKKKNAERKQEVKKVKDAEKKRSEWLEENLENDGEAGSESKGNSDGEHAVKESDQSDNETDALTSEQSSKKLKTKLPQKKVEKKLTNDKKVKQNVVKKSAKIEVEEPLAKKLKFTKPSLKQDSFFVTSSGSAYMATAVEERYQPAGPNDGLDRRERRAQKFGKSTGRPRPQPTTSFFDRNEQKKHSTPAIPEDIHPSWAAKQKVKGIEQFKGTKIKFNEEPKKLSIPTAENTLNREKLHPSWLAKQKLKPVISEFKGKKITFGD